MAVHTDPCRTIEEHVELEMSDPASAFPRLPDFVAGCIADWEAERRQIADVALADIYGIHREWTEAELRFAAGDR